MFVLAQLDNEQLKAVQEFERAEGVRLLALREMCVELDMLAADKLATLNALEQDLSICLLSVR